VHEIEQSGRIGGDSIEVDPAQKGFFLPAFQTDLGKKTKVFSQGRMALGDCSPETTRSIYYPFSRRMERQYDVVQRKKIRDG
jgi:hypothetical protein